MAIIKVTDFANEKTKYYINTKNIDGFYTEDDCSAVTDICTVGHCFRVKETPEEILALIERAENKEHTSCNNNNINEAKINPSVQELINQARAADCLASQRSKPRLYKTRKH